VALGAVLFAASCGGGVSQSGSGVGLPTFTAQLEPLNSYYGAEGHCSPSGPYVPSAGCDGGAPAGNSQPAIPRTKCTVYDSVGTAAMAVSGPKAIDACAEIIKSYAKAGSYWVDIEPHHALHRYTQCALTSAYTSPAVTAAVGSAPPMTSASRICARLIATGNWKAFGGV
jgi:hypothetical protein